MKENRQILAALIAIGSIAIAVMVAICVGVVRIDKAIDQPVPNETAEAADPRTDTAMAAALATATRQIQQDSVEIATLRDSLDTALGKLDAIYREYDKTMNVKRNKTFVDLIYQYERLAAAINKQKKQQQIDKNNYGIRRENQDAERASANKDPHNGEGG